MHDNRAVAGVSVVVLIVLAAALAPLVARYDPLAVDLTRQLEGP